MRARPRSKQSGVGLIARRQSLTRTLRPVALLTPLVQSVAARALRLTLARLIRPIAHTEQPRPTLRRTKVDVTRHNATPPRRPRPKSAADPPTPPRREPLLTATPPRHSPSGTRLRRPPREQPL